MNTSIIERFSEDDEVDELSHRETTYVTVGYEFGYSIGCRAGRRPKWLQPMTNDFQWLMKACEICYNESGVVRVFSIQDAWRALITLSLGLQKHLLPN